MKKMEKLLMPVLGLAGLIVLLMPVLLLVHSLGNLTEETVLQRLPSPEDSFVAEVIIRDQGAMGGSTLVEVFPAGKPEKGQLVYCGDWEAQYTLKIYWKSDTCLVINGREYTLP